LTKLVITCIIGYIINLSFLKKRRLKAFNQKQKKQEKKMADDHCLKAYFRGDEVEIHGGYQHHENGCHAEISGKKTRRCSVSIWELTFPNIQMAGNVFERLFNLTLDQAKQRDTEKRKVNDIYLKLKCVSIERTVERLVNKEEKKNKEEPEEEINCMLLERVELE